MRSIPFSPPDITEEEINEVVDTLRSGWITTGPKTKRFEEDITRYCNTKKTVCLNSATAGLESVLRLFDIGPGDEVITSPYTFAATANVIIHTGAKPVFVDVIEGEFNIDPEKIKKAITKRTKAIIPVDIAGWPCDYDDIYDVLDEKKGLYRPKKGSLQENLDRPLLLIDAAHSFGAKYKGEMSGACGDFTVFSFHAVKNLTTAEGGAVTFKGLEGCTTEDIYKRLMLLSLHGQSKDALSKMKAGGWQYSIDIPGYKCNMTDITASIGIVQLKRFPEMQRIREQLYRKYFTLLKDNENIILPNFSDPMKECCFHLMPIRIKNADEMLRSEVIKKMSDKKIATNVHFTPVTMHPAYTKLGYKIKDTPFAFDSYKNEITLPLYSKLTMEDVEYVCKSIKEILSEIL